MPETAILLLILLPFAGAVFTAFMKAPHVARAFALLVGTLTFVASLIVAREVMAGNTVIWGTENNPLSIREIGFAFRLSCDGISLWLVLLTTFVTPLAILSVGREINDLAGANWYYTWLLVLLGSLLGTFLADDGLLFYAFFELTLVPTLLLIAIWGGPERRQAAGKFFIYTFAGSVFLLISLIYLAAKTPGNSLQIASLIDAAQNHLTGRERFWVGLGLLVGFLIKTPVFPLHTWQPLTYGESPNAAVAIIGGVLSKLGTYGLLRLTLPLALVGLPTDSGLTKAVIVLCLISIIYGGLIAWVQKDMVRLMAYSSLSHLGLCVLAIVAASTLSLQGAVMYMVTHGLATAALLLVIGMIHRRTGTRNIDQISGLFAKMPVLGTLLVLFTLASIGLPITSGFVGEFLSLQGIMNSFGLGVTIVASVGMVLGAIYMLHMVARVGFGPLRAPEGADLTDIGGREVGTLLPLAVAVLALGITPTPALNSFRDDVARISRPTNLLIPSVFTTQNNPSKPVAEQAAIEAAQAN